MPSGYTLYRAPNEVGGHTYTSDEVGSGVLVWDTCCVAESTLRAALEWERDAESRAILEAAGVDVDAACERLQTTIDQCSARPPAAQPAAEVERLRAAVEMGDRIIENHQKRVGQYASASLEADRALIAERAARQAAERERDEARAELQALRAALTTIAELSSARTDEAPWVAQAALRAALPEPTKEPKP